jgi:hypothetical protein
MEATTKYNRSTRQPVLIIHGHKHVTFREVYRFKGGHVHIYGHPSSTMGEFVDGVYDQKASYARIGLVDGRWAVETVTVTHDSTAAHRPDAQDGNNSNVQC